MVINFFTHMNIVVSFENLSFLVQKPLKKVFRQTFSSNYDTTFLHTYPQPYGIRLLFELLKKLAIFQKYKF